MLVLTREKETDIPKIMWMGSCGLSAYVCVCVCVCVNAHAHLLGYALSFYSLHIFSMYTYIAEITYLSFGKHWYAE